MKKSQREGAREVGAERQRERRGEGERGFDCKECGECAREIV